MVSSGTVQGAKPAAAKPGKLHGAATGPTPQPPGRVKTGTSPAPRPTALPPRPEPADPPGAHVRSRPMPPSPKPPVSSADANEAAQKRFYMTAGGGLLLVLVLAFFAFRPASDEAPAPSLPAASPDASAAQGETAAAAPAPAAPSVPGVSGGGGGSRGVSGGQGRPGAAPAHDACGARRGGSHRGRLHGRAWPSTRFVCPRHLRPVRQRRQPQRWLGATAHERPRVGWPRHDAHERSGQRDRPRHRPERDAAHAQWLPARALPGRVVPRLARRLSADGSSQSDVSG